MDSYFESLARRVISERVEHGLLLNCAFVDRTSFLASLTHDDERVPDWQALASMLAFHGMNVAALGRLIDAGIKHMPESFRHELREAAAINMIESRRHQRALQDVCRILDANGIPFVVFKGMALWLQLGMPVEERLIVDADVLIQESDLQRLLEQIYAAGLVAFGWLDFEDRDYAFKSGIWSASLGEYPFLKDGFVLDVHWEIFKRQFCHLPAAELLSQKVTVPDPGFNLPVLKPEAHAVVVAAHACKHEFFALKWLTDIVGFCHYAELDWTQTLELSRRSGSESCLYISLVLAALISSSARDRLAQLFQPQPELDRQAAELLRRALQMRGESWPSPRYWGYRVAIKKSLFERLAVLYELSTDAPPNLAIKARLGRKFYWLHRHLYPFVWLARLPGSLVKTMKGRK